MRLSDFAGHWRLSRRIEDHAAGQVGLFEGEAVFTADAGGLAYREEGTLRFGSGAPMRAERRYFWREVERRIVVTFADGAPFHDFTAAGQGSGTPHLCGADLYRVTYDFAHWPAWRAEWQVAGPRKDYTSISDYSRA